jgi:hypothetical protein
MSDEADKKHVDWELIEKDYRAGIKTLRQIGEERGVSHTAIQKKAKQFGWVRDLSEKIQQKAKDKVAKQVVAKSVSKERQLSDAETVEAYSDVVASVDMIQRDDVKLAVDTSRGHLQELVTLTDPAYKDKLEWLADLMDCVARVRTEKGKKDPKVNEQDLERLLAHMSDLPELYALFKYTTTLHSRVKLAKEIAASHSVYLPLQRKIFGLDTEKKSTGEFEEMLRQVQLQAD